MHGSLSVYTWCCVHKEEDFHDEPEKKAVYGLGFVTNLIIVHVSFIFSLKCEGSLKVQADSFS